MIAIIMVITGVPFVFAGGGVMPAEICMSVNAQNVIEEFKKNHLLAGSQSVVYTVPTCKYTAAPKGYTPFYLSHYGRHGSR